MVGIAVAIVVVVGLLVALAEVGSEVALAMGFEVLMSYDVSSAGIAVVGIDGIAVGVVSSGHLQTAVSPTIVAENGGCIVVEERAVAVGGVNAEVPREIARINRTIEVVLGHEADVL